MCGYDGGKTTVEQVVPDEKDFVGGDVLRWDGIVVFPNASKLAKLVFELPWGAAAIHKEKLTVTMNVKANKTMAGDVWDNDQARSIFCYDLSKIKGTFERYLTGLENVQSWQSW